MEQLNIALLIITIISLCIYYKLTTNEVMLIESMIDNREYIVNNFDDKQDAADLLAQIRKNISTMRTYLVKNKDKFSGMSQYIKLLDERFDGVVIKEKTDKNNYTSYSVNKGEEIIFCLRSKKDNSIHDINLMMYVALHEFAHVACPEINHTDLFKKIFKFFIEIAILLDLYTYVDYGTDVKEYCGIYIDETIL